MIRLDGVVELGHGVDMSSTNGLPVRCKAGTMIQEAAMDMRIGGKPATVEAQSSLGSLCHVNCVLSIMMFVSILHGSGEVTFKRQTYYVFGEVMLDGKSGWQEADGDLYHRGWRTYIRMKVIII